MTAARPAAEARLSALWHALSKLFRDHQREAHSRLLCEGLAPDEVDIMLDCLADEQAQALDAIVDEPRRILASGATEGRGDKVM